MEPNATYQKVYHAKFFVAEPSSQFESANIQCIIIITFNNYTN